MRRYEVLFRYLTDANYSPDGSPSDDDDYYMVGTVTAGGRGQVQGWIDRNQIGKMEQDGMRREITELFHTESYREGTLEAVSLLSGPGHAVPQARQAAGPARAVSLVAGMSPIPVLESYMSVPGMTDGDSREEFEEAVHALEGYKEKKEQGIRYLEGIKAGLRPNRAETPKGEFIIWSNKDAGDDADVLRFIEDCPDECMGLSLDEIRERCYGECNRWMNDETENLHHEYRKLYGNGRLDMLIIIDTENWRGRHRKYKTITDTDIKAIFTEYLSGNATVYGDGKDIRARCTHHDGTDYYTFRRMPPGCPWPANGEITGPFLEKHTKSLWPVAALCYGWDTGKNQAGPKKERE